jgi:Cu/Ag efflux protein CusF
MKHWIAFGAGLVAMALIAAMPAFGQQTQPDTQTKTSMPCAPEKVDGQVVRVDHASGKVTVRDKSGTMHEFQTSAEMTNSIKPGDKIEAILREGPRC